MARPPNLSGDARGFNSQMFKSDRAVRRGFRMLGYAVNPRDHKVPKSTVQQFQRDYNKCAERFGRWGKVEVSGRIGKTTLNALEHAVRWSKKRENREGIPTARSWQALCANRRAACLDTECVDGRNYSAPPEVGAEAYATVTVPEAREENFVEVLPVGRGKLRNIHTDDALRCNILGFERHAEVIFAIVEVPPQRDLPGGRSDSITCPCVLGR